MHAGCDVDTAACEVSGLGELVALVRLLRLGVVWGFREVWQIGSSSAWIGFYLNF